MHAIGTQGRHIFWTAPAGRVPLRMVNPGLGIRRIFMGQAEPAQANRLLGVRTNVILSRASLLVPASVPLPAIPPGYAGLLPAPYTGARGSSRTAAGKRELEALFPFPAPKWTPEEKAAIEAAAAAPTPEELDVAKLIDSFFGFHKYPLPQPFDHLGFRGGGGKLGLAHLLACEGTSYAEGRTSRRVPPWSTSPFYCTGARPSMAYSLKADQFFGIDPATKWGDQALVARNARVLLGELGSYPLPSPLSAAPGMWFRIAQAKLSEAARSTFPLDPQVARFMVTLIVLDTYEPAANAIMDYFKDKEKKAKKYAIIKLVALAVVSLVLPAVAAAGLAALTTVIDAREAREAAKDMAKAAKQFAASDARFAAELQHAAEILDYQAAQEAAAAALTEEEAAAIAQPGQEGEITPEQVEAAAAREGGGIPTELLVGGGVAAAAAVALAFLAGR